MTKLKNTSAGNPTVLNVTQTSRETEAQASAWAATSPQVNAALVMDAYQGNILGSDVKLMALIESLNKSTDKTTAGDLSNLEAMLVGQATALQSIFTSLAQRAARSQQQTHLESFMGLALKAQAQSRATISALVDLKYPRQATFVRQANIAHGPQQVNNGGITHAREIESQPNELLEDASYERTQMDTGAKTAATRGDPAMEALEPVHRAAKPRRQSHGSK